MNVCLNHFYILVETGCVSEMQNPIQFSSQKYDNISFFQCKRSCCTYIQRMRVWHHSFSHWCWQKWDFYFFNEFPHLLFSSSICGALTNNDKWLFGESNNVDSLFEFRKRWAKGWWLSKNGYLDFAFNHFIEDITWKIEENRAWPSGGRKSDCFIDMVWDIFCRCDSDTIFGVRFYEIALIDLLESAFFGLVKII
jgi:hypothetical protein